MLQIRVHHDHIVCGGVLQTGIHRRFLAEVAREANVFDIVKPRGKPLHNKIGFVTAAVVHQNIAEGIVGQGVDHLVGFQNKVLQPFLVCFFVILSPSFLL